MKWMSRKTFIIQDFAMKFFPRHFKETQIEWLGKLGISWHISHCVRHTSSKKCEVSVYSHLIRSQSARAVKLLLQLRITPSRKKRQDTQILMKHFIEATVQDRTHGLLVPIRPIGRLTCISIKRYDFSEPQAGKGPCDRSSVHQKSYVNRFLN